MIIYISIIIYSLICLYFYDYKKEKAGISINKYTILIILILYSGLRYRVGTDTFMYEEIFNHIPILENITTKTFTQYKIEPLWIVITSLIKTLFNNFIYLQLFCSILINAAVFFFFKDKKYLFTAYFFYIIIDYLLLNFEFMRQATGVAIFYLLIYPKLEKKKYLAYIVGCIMCGFIHSTLFLSLLIPIINNINFSLKRILIITCITYIFLQFFSIFNLLSSLVPENANITYKIISYSEDIKSNINLNYIISKTYSLIIIFICLYINRSFKYKNIIFLYILSILLTSSSDIFARLQYVVFTFKLALYAESFILVTKRKYMKSILCPLFIIMIYLPIHITLMHEYAYGLHNYSKYFPYYSYLNPQKDPQREKLNNGKNQFLYILK